MSVFTSLALGLAMLSSVGYTTLSSILADTTKWVTGSIISTGNFFFLPDDNTVHTPGFYVGTTKVLSLTGSTTIPNSIIYDTTNNQPACKKYGSRFFDCYQQVVFSNSGGCVAGGCAVYSYNVGSLTRPYTGTGVIKRAEISCDLHGKVTPITVGTVSTLSQSGSDILFRKNSGSGAYASTITGNTASALTAYSGAILWTEAKPYVKISAGASVGTNPNCLLSIWSDQMYDP